MRPIDADALMNHLERKRCWEINKKFLEGFNDCMLRVRSMVHSAPTLVMGDVGRERVEEMWRGEWKESKDFDYGFWICSRCGFVSEASAAPKLYKFCPNCGCPLTDEAVQMVMERLEAMKDEAD